VAGAEVGVGFDVGFVVHLGAVDLPREADAPWAQSLEFYTDLKKRGVPSRLIVLEKAGHWPAWYEMALYYDAHLDWFHRYLGGEKAPVDVVQMARGLATP